MRQNRQEGELAESLCTLGDKRQKERRRKDNISKMVSECYYFTLIFKTHIFGTTRGGDMDSRLEPRLGAGEAGELLSPVTIIEVGVPAPPPILIFSFTPTPTAGDDSRDSLASCCKSEVNKQ